MPGELLAKGTNGGKEVAESRVATTGPAKRIALTPDRTAIRADGRDVAIIRVAIQDAAGSVVPVADNEVVFAVTGAGRLIGVNGRASFEKRGRVNVGVGYAISANQLRNFMGQLRARPDVMVRINAAPGVFASGDWPAVRRELLRVLTLAGDRDKVCIGTGVLPFETNPDIVLKAKAFVREEVRTSMFLKTPQGCGIPCTTL
jgi:hypothetical protein